MKLKLAAAASIVTLVAAAAAAAFTGDHINIPDSATSPYGVEIVDAAGFAVSGNVNGTTFTNEHEVGGIIELYGVNVTQGSMPITIEAYCVDLLDPLSASINLGAPGGGNVDYIATNLRLADTGNGQTMSAATLSYVEGLVYVGMQMANNLDAAGNGGLTDITLTPSQNVQSIEPAIQAAIWQAEYGVSIDFTSAGSGAGIPDPSGLQSYGDGTTPLALSTWEQDDLNYLNANEAGIAALGGYLPALTSSAGVQSIAVGFSSSPIQAPEPRSWALMILGVGIVGGALRRGRANRALAARAAA
ncbi:MAG TPA: PEPxxWA-CTERM sorting domain-containing protein [Caulobacteraceae bacterium]|jgi:hypothetical protein|nr:PEPxxWA-CTERM sorting domain-containing protein [Caulobacteraceae bacterium]